MKQPALDLLGGDFVSTTPPLRAAIAAGDPLPPGPYAVGLTHWQAGDGSMHQGPPFTVVCGDGRAVAGHVESRTCAEAIAVALNRAHPVGGPAL